MSLDASRFEHRGAKIHQLAEFAQQGAERLIIKKGQFTEGRRAAWMRSGYNRDAHIELKNSLVAAYGKEVSAQVIQEYGIKALFDQGKHLSGKMVEQVLLRAEELSAPNEIEQFMGESLANETTQDAVVRYLYSQIGNKAKVDYALKHSLLFTQAIRNENELTAGLLGDLLDEIDLETRKLDPKFVDQALNIPSQPKKGPKKGQKAPHARVYSDLKVQSMIDKGKVGGLKAYGNSAYAIEQSGIRYDEQCIENISDMYAFVAMKDKGVEPGVKARKRFRHDDFNKTFHEPTHKFYQKAEVFIENQIQDANSPIGSFVAALEESDALPTKKEDIFKLIKADPACQASIIEHITSTEPKFVKIHFIKLDYFKEDTKTIMGQKYVYIPKAQSKGMLHRLGTGKTPKDANFGAVRECLANDMLALLGTHAQKLKIIGTQYDDGTPKLLLDGTFMTGPNNEPFKDFSGHIVDGYLVSGNDAKRANQGQLGHNETIPADGSIEKLGKFKVMMLLLGDRDAIGSRGDNKGRCGNTFAAIDPGHSFEVFPSTKFRTNLMEFQNVHSDCSFDQPNKPMDKLTKGYKNFTIFDDTPYLEKLEGVEELLMLRDSGEDELLFDAYMEAFNGIGEDGEYHAELDFRQEIQEIKEAYMARRDDFLDRVFADRIPFLPSMGKPYGPAALTMVDSLEKLTSITSETSPNGTVQLKHLRVVERTPWVIGEDPTGSVTFTCQSNDLTTVRQRLGSLFDHIDASKIKLQQKGDSIVISVPRDEVENLGKIFNEEAVREAKRARGQFEPAKDDEDNSYSAYGLGGFY